MKRLLENIDLHIVIVGILMALVGGVLVGTLMPTPRSPLIVLAWSAGLVGGVLSPMILIRVYDYRQFGREAGPYVLAQILVLLICMGLTFGILWIVPPLRHG